MKLSSTLIATCGLTGFALANVIPNEHGLYARSDILRRMTRRPTTRSQTSAARGRSPSPGGWSDTSDSSRSSVDSAGRSGIGNTRVETEGRHVIVHKKKGNPNAQRITTGPGSQTHDFTGPEKTRTKVKGLDDNGTATMTMHGGKARLTVDARGSGQEAGIGQTRYGHEHYGAVETNEKAVFKGDASSDITRSGIIGGKGKMRGALVPKRPQDIKPVAEMFSHEGPDGKSIWPITGLAFHPVHPPSS